ncbi:uncharacterized protein VTP21DRAFT_9368 [Calcarisporiella thermophila]|uniref:uncharacterized protein n=1 Tax=Calcarisporiella thermophila TaxID=911321 RepID=UPI003743BDD8
MARRRAEHDRIFNDLEQDFQRLNSLVAGGDVQPLGGYSQPLFKELDLIRRKQIALAVEHIALENIFGEENKPAIPDVENEASTKSYRKSVEDLAKKDHELNGLMAKLEDLRQSMSAFHDLSLNRIRVNPQEKEQWREDEEGEKEEEEEQKEGTKPPKDTRNPRDVPAKTSSVYKNTRSPNLPQIITDQQHLTPRTKSISTSRKKHPLAILSDEEQHTMVESPRPFV